MNDPVTRHARHAVRRAARQLAEDAPRLTAGSASALRAGLRVRTARLRGAALAAWLTGVPEHVIAADGRVPVAVVRHWIAARKAPRHPGDRRP
ncbi:hypothetical protein J2Z21_000217 [Streptomyces griseochromogenes]|uniref:Uncharacterized protein n=1 Tax=Streptomyces griseochromogenes TaxID=68214 RepID=A0A1B1B1Q8_9ACTN|nr:hypothetical protein [Streptomyces griseochromogenes]ANP52691.1 hypothetical protein AVL59_26975 [Streptomyces griseochromogenes]MBP2047295.1 hypothetical protein [Streptomyces griseochromogenes]